MHQKRARATSLLQYQFVLAPDVHHACVGGDAVLLDVRGDGYHCLPDGAALCRRLAGGGLVRMNGPVSALIAAGLIGAEPSPKPRVPPARPVRSVIHAGGRLDLMRDLIPGLCAMHEVRAARRGAGLSPYVSLGGAEPRDAETDSRPARWAWHYDQAASSGIWI